MDNLTLAALCVSVCAEAVHASLPYVVAVYMVRDFLGKDADEQRVGRYTGALTSFYFVGQFLTAYAWGHVSDKYGRKPILVMSNVSALIMGACYGLAGSYPLAALSRFIPSLFSCTFGMIRCILADTLDVNTQAVKGGYITVSWSLGSVLGPAIGGGLSAPCGWLPLGLPLCNTGGILARKPYLLPCLVASGLSVIASFCSISLLSESRTRPLRHAAVGETPGEHVAFKEGTLGEHAGATGQRPVEEATPSEVQPWLDVGTPTGSLLVATSGLSLRRSLNPSRRSSLTASARPSLEGRVLARSDMRRSSFAERFQRRIEELGEAGTAGASLPASRWAQRRSFNPSAATTPSGTPYATPSGTPYSEFPFTPPPAHTIQPPAGPAPPSSHPITPQATSFAPEASLEAVTPVTHPASAFAPTASPEPVTPQASAFAAVAPYLPFRMSIDERRSGLTTPAGSPRAAQGSNTRLRTPPPTPASSSGMPAEAGKGLLPAPGKTPPRFAPSGPSMPDASTGREGGVLGSTCAEAGGLAATSGSYGEAGSRSAANGGGGARGNDNEPGWADRTTPPPNMSPRTWVGSLTGRLALPGMVASPPPDGRGSHQSDDSDGGRLSVESASPRAHLSVQEGAATQAVVDLLTPMTTARGGESALRVPSAAVPRRREGSYLPAGSGLGSPVEGLQGGVPGLGEEAEGSSPRQANNVQPEFPSGTREGSRRPIETFPRVEVKPLIARSHSSALSLDLLRTQSANSASSGRLPSPDPDPFPISSTNNFTGAQTVPTFPPVQNGAPEVGQGGTPGFQGSPRLLWKGPLVDRPTGDTAQTAGRSADTPRMAPRRDEGSEEAGDLKGGGEAGSGRGSGADPEGGETCGGRVRWSVELLRSPFAQFEPDKETPTGRRISSETPTGRRISSESGPDYLPGQVGGAGQLSERPSGPHPRARLPRVRVGASGRYNGEARGLLTEPLLGSAQDGAAAYKAGGRLRGESAEGGVGESEHEQEPLLGVRKAEPVSRWYHDRLLLLLMVGYGLISLFSNIADEVVPLLAAAPREAGGLALVSAQLALPTTFSGTVLATWALFGVAWAQSRFGARGCCRAGVACYAVVVLGIPLVSLLSAHPHVVLPVLALVLSARQIAAQNAFSGSMLMFISVAPSGEMGTVNGAAQTLASFMRAIGPALGGLTWALCTRIRAPLHQALPFVVVSIGLVGTRLLYSYVDLPPPEEQDEAQAEDAGLTEFV